MTKFLTAAAWSALVLGGTAVADTPPSEAPEATTEEVATEAMSDVKTIRYGEKAEAETEAEAVAKVANVTIEGETDAEVEGDELNSDAEEASDSDGE